MQYRCDPKSGNQLSALGYGCMRFTKKAGVIDQEKAEQEMLYALNRGVNYFDTAYIYPGSETALGKFLAKGYRDKVYIATKLPHYMVKNTAQAEKIFQEELSRLQTDFIDYYLMHMLNSLENWERLSEMGIKEWIAEKKATGQIRQIGFSYHGGSAEFIRILEAFDWDFCQIQFNYMDEHSQGGIEGLTRAGELGIPVIIMEPLRGGRLTHGLPESAKEIFAREGKGKSPAEWSFRWIWNHPQVTCVLSGMNDLSQIEENIRVAEDSLPASLCDRDFQLIAKVKAEIDAKIKVPCTGCGYCMPCPRGVDIPTCFRCLNVHASDGWFNGLREYLMGTTLRKVKTNASLCIGCGKCEAHCPQSIAIRKELKTTVKTLERIPYRTARLVSKLLKF